MKKLNIYTFFLTLLMAAGLNAQQVTLMMPDMAVEPGANVHVDVQVENFDDIAGVQFSINWDKNVLSFIGVDNFGLPDLSVDGNFGTVETSGGKLRFVWYQQDLSGVTLDDNSTIFSIWFKATGTPNSSTQIAISNEPIVIEVVSVNGMLPYTVDNGTITVQGSTASKETLTTDFVLYQNSPNPFDDITYISFSLEQNMQAELSIFDPSGKVIFKQNKIFATGLNRIPVSRDILQSPGSYFYSLKTEKAIATRQLIAQ